MGVGFTQPTTVASSSPQFSGSAAVSATLCVVREGKVFDPDLYDTPIAVPGGCAYLGIGLKISVAPGVQVSPGKLTFGFAVGSTVCLSHYRRFAADANAPTFTAALQAGLQNYVIPLSPEDFAALGVGDIATIEGAGTLQFCGTFDILTAVNPLVSISIAALPTTLQIQEGAAVNVSASGTITGDLQIRVQKLDAGTIRMGVYRKRGVDATVQVSPSIGVTAGTAKIDFIAAVLGAVGPSPFPSADQLHAAGLTEEKQEAMVGALKSGIQRSLALSIAAGLHAADSQEAAFVYEISLHDLGADGRSALQEALRLNFSALSDAALLPAGIREVRSVLTTTRKQGLSLKLNVLGIYNFTSVSDLVLQGKVLSDPLSGEVVITDSATATRVSGAIDFLADADKLRRVLAQSFLLTAAYRCSGLIAHTPSLKASYWHFDEHPKTDRATMAADLNALLCMGLISAAQQDQGLAHAGDFGRSTFYLGTDYDDAVSESLFLQAGGQPRGRDEYERIGRQALQLLLRVDSGNDFRLQPLQDDATWARVKETGGTVVNLAQVLPDLDGDSQIPIVAGDYVLIAWWATTMSRMAQSLAAARKFFSQTPPASADSADFKKVQADLWHQMASVVSNTHDRFSDPWGLLAMDLASGQQCEATARIVSAGLALSAERNHKLTAAP